MASNDHQSERQFKGPSEKRHFYISQILSQVIASDPLHKHFSKLELVELEAALRKTIPGNPQLYKLIQTIVDDCLILDDEMLKLFENVQNEPTPDVSEADIALVREQVEEQKWLMQLAQFNVNRRAQKSPFAKSHKQSNETPDLESIRLEVESNYSKSILSEKANCIVSDFKSSIFTIAKLVSELDQLTSSFESLFKIKLIDTDHMVSLCLFADQSDVQSMRELLEKEKGCKMRFVILSRMFCDFADLLTRFETQLDRFKSRQKVVSYLEKIKSRQDALFSNIAEQHAVPTDTLQTLVKFVRDSLPDLSLEPFLEKLYELQQAVIILENQTK